MTFTKREQRRGEWTAWGMRAFLAGLIIGMLGFGSGCTSQATTVAERTEELTGYAQTLKDAGFKGRALVIWGTSHAGGQAFNISGSSGFIEISFGDDE